MIDYLQRGNGLLQMRNALIVLIQPFLDGSNSLLQFLLNRVVIVVVRELMNFRLNFFDFQLLKMSKEIQNFHLPLMTINDFQYQHYSSDSRALRLVLKENNSDTKSPFLIRLTFTMVEERVPVFCHRKTV